MKRIAGLFVCVLAAAAGPTAMAATPSVNGANVFAQSSIIDAQGDVWDIVSGVIEKNGVHVGSNFNVNLLLEYDQFFYQRNTSDEWYRWTGSSWSKTNDPRVVAASGTRIGVGADVLVDSEKHVWTLPTDEYAYVDGSRAASNYNTISVLYYDNIIYSENTSDEWYSWNGSAWTRVSGDPTTSNTGVASANGASIGVGAGTLVDSGGNVWTLQTNEYAYRNGSRAASNYNTISVLYYDNIIYSENTSGEWYAWNGSAWTKVSGNPQVSGDPRGPNLVQYRSYTSPVCPADDPGCTPPFVGNSSVTFTQVTTKGNTIWVAATVSDYGGTHTITVTDSQNNTYHELNQGNDKAPGSQSVAQFYASNILGGADTVTVNWSADNYKGVVAAELAGVTASPLLGHAADVQDGNLASGSDSVSSTGMAVSSSGAPALLVALTMDTDGGGSDTGGTGFCAVPAGTGFTQVTQLWNWSAAGQPACNLATLETKTVAGSGNVAGSFTTTHPSDPYVTVAAVFQ
ncbi:MAG: hypothetical protein ACLQO1_05270 [Steroidobacteraceae bacterium]